MTSTPIEQSPLFTRWHDPVTGVESYILSRRVAPLQQSFYYVNPSVAHDGRFFWLYVSFPPGGDTYYGRQLAVVDLAEQTIHHYPETQFMDASPYVDSETGEVYWTTGLEIWKRGPLPGDRTTLVASFPKELANNRRPLRLATHLTRSADKKSFAIDTLLGADCYVGDLPIDGTTPFRPWQSFNMCYNHAQFSPTDPDTIMIAQDGWFDPATGKPGTTEDRIWLIERGGKARPLLPGFSLNSDWRGHEWWDADGEHVWFIDYRRGTQRANIRTGKVDSVWPGGHTHSHTDQKGQYIAGDIMPIRDQFRLAFFNIKTGREIDIVTQFPQLDMPRSRYHVHPHPQFCYGDRYVAYTTNVFGTVDYAFVSVEQLVSRTS
jgi:hypothetical protein